MVINQDYTNVAGCVCVYCFVPDSVALTQFFRNHFVSVLHSFAFSNFFFLLFNFVLSKYNTRFVGIKFCCPVENLALQCKRRKIRGTGEISFL